MATGVIVAGSKSALDRLSPKQRLWLEAYIANNGNATKAAAAAGYSTPAQAGHKVKHTPLVQEALTERYRQASMSADEVLARLADQARATMDDALETYWVIDTAGEVEKDEDNLPVQYDAITGEGIAFRAVTRVNLEYLRDSGLVHQVQAISYDKFGQPIVKLVDKQGALDKIARGLGIYQGEGAGVQVVIKDLRGVDVEAV